jgi:hypothetical protein
VMTDRAQYMRNAAKDPKKPPDASFNANNILWLHGRYKQLMAAFLIDQPSNLELEIARALFVRTLPQYVANAEQYSTR